MTQTIADLEADGLIERRPDPTDGRRTLVELTARACRRSNEDRRHRDGWLRAGDRRRSVAARAAAARRRAAAARAPGRGLSAAPPAPAPQATAARAIQTDAMTAAHQAYLLQARQMQALSFAVHIPLVCFGIAFPAMVLFVEWLLPAHRRRALPHARPPLDADHGRAVRRRRDHRHDPQLRDGPAVAELHRHVRQRVRARLRDRGLLVLHRGDLHRHLRLRLGPPVAARALRSAGSRS